MNSVNAFGTKISTTIRQASFDPLNVEALMYMGKNITSMFGREIKKASWAQLQWMHLGCAVGESDCENIFNVNGPAENVNAMDYLLAVALEHEVPTVTLRNTAPPRPFRIQFAPQGTAVDAQSAFENGTELYFYQSDGSSGVAAGTIYIGSLQALTNSVFGANLPQQQDIVNPCDNGACNCTHHNNCGSNHCRSCNTCLPAYNCAYVKPFISYTPRHRVGWGQNAIIALHECISFAINGVDYEPLSTHALYNALQYRVREDIYEVAVDEATNIDAVFVQANVGNGPQAILSLCGDERYKAFVAPFSFTTSALADRSLAGKHTSAFPVLLACRSNIQIRDRLIDDARKLLILEEEVLGDVSHMPVVFVATASELAVTSQIPNSTFISDGTNLFTLNRASFGQVIVSETQSYYSTSAVTSYNVLFGDQSRTFSSQTPFTIGNFNVCFLEQTSTFLPLTRPTDYCLDNPFSCDIDYRHWIQEEHLKFHVKAKALGAMVTDLERGLMKADCRSKKYLYERYQYYDDCSGIKPGDKTQIEITAVPGQFKYAYVVAQNEISKAQGNFFNYTNDTDYHVMDTRLGPRLFFPGKSALERTRSTIQGFNDEEHPYGFYRFVDNPLFAQRAPLTVGSIIAPRYANWINSIQPDGSINPQVIGDVRLFVKTAKSGMLDCRHHQHYNKPNSYGFNVIVIAVSWNVILFEPFIANGGCKAPLQQ